MKDAIIIHCSATRAEQDITAADIESWHRARGFWTIGYHYVIRLDGTIEPGRDVTLDGAHCMGWNKRAIGICYVGGLDKDGRPADTRTDAQRTALIRLVKALRLVFPGGKQVLGQRETIPDLNGDGVNDCIVTSDPNNKSPLKILFIDGASEAGHKLSQGTSGNILPATAIERKWHDYKYVKPIPTTALQENPNLTQNPEW